MTDPIVTIDDIRKTGHCVAGIKTWFGLHGLDFRDFLDHGIPASKLIDTGDELAFEVMRKIEERKSHG